jgi:hypothetical protein
MNDLRPLPPNLRNAPLAPALLRIELSHRTSRSMGDRDRVRPPTCVQNDKEIWPVIARGVT